MLIGQVLNMSFGRYLLEASVPVVPAWPRSGCCSRGRRADAGRTGGSRSKRRPTPGGVTLDRWQPPRPDGGRRPGGDIPVHAVAARGGGADRRRAAVDEPQAAFTRDVGQVDWELLILFIGLFVVNRAFADTGLAEQAVQWLAGAGVPLSLPVPLFAATFVLSNVLSNVPAVMLLLPMAKVRVRRRCWRWPARCRQPADRRLDRQHHRGRGRAPARIEIGWRQHARTGVPVTLVTLAITAAWLVGVSPEPFAACCR